MAHFKETIIISMGGSLLIPKDIDVSFIKDLKTLVRHFTNDGYQIVLVIGGGKVCRNYQAAAREFDNVTDTDLDWIGIKTIRLNCELIFRILFSANAVDESCLNTLQHIRLLEILNNI